MSFAGYLNDFWSRRPFGSSDEEKAEFDADVSAIRRAVAGEDIFAAGKLEKLPSQAIYQRTVRDQIAMVQMATLSLNMIKTAKLAAQRGQMNILGDVYAVLKTCDPVLKAARGQRLNGVARVPNEITPAGDGPEFAKACDCVKGAFLKSRAASIASLARAIVECSLEGGGLVEIVWNEPPVDKKDGAISDKSRYPVKFVPIPMKRIRYGQDGGLRFAETSVESPLEAKPFEEYPEGTFIPVLVDEDVDNFGDRGSYRPLLSDCYARIKLFASWLSALERYANPIPVGKGKLKSSRDLLSKAFENLGSSGAIVTDYDSDVSLVYSTVAQRGSGPYTEFLVKTDQRIFLSLLGESQTGMIESGAGSTASAETHRKVAQDVAEADWELIGQLAARWVFEPLVRMNLGDKYVEFTPALTADFDEVGDLLALGQGVEKWVSLGLEDFTVEWARKKLKLPERKPGDTPLKAAPKPPAFAPPGGTGSDSPGSAPPGDSEDPNPPKGGNPAPPPPKTKASPAKAETVKNSSLSRGGVNDLAREIAGLADTIETGTLEAAIAAVEASKCGPLSEEDADALMAEIQRLENKRMAEGVASMALLFARIQGAMSLPTLWQMNFALRVLENDFEAAADVAEGIGISSSYAKVLESLRAKKALPKDVFDHLTASERSNAFATALKFEGDLLAQVHQAITDTITAGGDARVLGLKLEPILESFGRGGEVSAWRLNLIYQMEFTRAANAGLYAVMFSRDGLAASDGWTFYCREDACEICKPLGGLTFRKSDEASWALLPGLHFKCRCTAIGTEIKAGMEVSNGADFAGTGDEGFTFDKITPLRSLYGDDLGVGE